MNEWLFFHVLQGDTYLSVLDLPSGNETLLIQLLDGYQLETLLLSHQDTTKNVLFVSAYIDTGNNRVTRLAFFYSLVSGDLMFEFNISNTIGKCITWTE